MAVLLSSCSSVFNSDKINYKSQASAQPVTLDIPPDLTQLSKDTRYRIPGEQVSANALGLNTQVNTTPTIGATKTSDISISRLGTQRWLLVQRSPDDVWPAVKQFWLDNGFAFVKEDDKVGLLETDWAENKATTPQDFFGKTLKSFLGSVMSTGIKDKFITRLEAVDNKQVEIFISHRSVEDVGPTNSNPMSSFKTRASDPELENEFLKRLMIRLGANEKLAAEVAKPLDAPLAAKASLDNQDKTSKITYQEGFDTAWRRVGLALDRSGFTVEDRDRKAGLYFVRFVDRTNDGKETGFFTRLFSSSTKDEGPQRYRLKLEAQGDAKTVIVIQNSSGDLDGSNAGAKIAQLLLEELK
jgi:outer membrane protein assembly factor BamC